jgi:hypothetical protein
MALFGRKKKEEKVEKPKEAVAEAIKEEKQKQERPAFAPLFVKLDRYRRILSILNHLKNMMNVAKNSLVVLNDLERMRAENLKMIEDILNKIDQKLLSLDSEFMRPSGFREEPMEYVDVEGLESTIVDLKSQIDSLKTELERMA